MERTETFPPMRFYHSIVHWNICNYFQYLDKVETVIVSREFVTDLRYPIKWRFKIILKRAQDKLHLSGCILSRSASCRGPKHVVVKTQMSLQDSEGIAWYDFPRDYCFYRDTEIDLGNSDNRRNSCIPHRDTIFINGTIRIKCEFVEDYPLHFIPSDTESDLWNLSNDFKTLYMMGNLTDLDLIADKETFSVHRAIVKARAPLIADMLNDDKSLRKLKLPRIVSAPVLKGLIVYWYSGELVNLPKTPCACLLQSVLKMGHYELEPYVQPENLEVTTNFKSPNRSINWVIEDSEFCEYLRHLNGKKFHTYESNDLPWKLVIYPKGITGEEHFISLVITSEFSYDCNEGYVEVFFKDENGTEYGGEHFILRPSKPSSYTFPRFMRHDKLARLRGILLNRNILEIGCRMFFGADNILYSAGRKQYCTKLCNKFPSRIEHPYKLLVDTMKSLFLSGDMSDLSLISRGKSFRVHSAILAARSRYFNDLLIKQQDGGLDDDDDESPNTMMNEMLLEDIEPNDLDMILQYVYYAKKILLNSELALRLYPPCRKYKITCLDNICSDYLKNNLSVENGLNIIKLAETFNDEYLKVAAETFVKANWDKILKTEENLKNLLHSGDMSDFSLISHGKSFRVHSEVLAAHSRYFNYLLVKRPERGFPKINEIVLEDIEPGDLEMILQYVYYAKKMVLSSELALRLYPFFRKYKIKCLDNICSDYLKHNLSVKNVKDVVELADFFNDESLKLAAEAFFYANWDNILETETSYRLQNTNKIFSTEIMSKE